MNYRDVTIGIVTFKSKKVIFDCLRSSLYSTSCFWLNNPFTERGSFGCFAKTALETEL